MVVSGKSYLAQRNCFLLGCEEDEPRRPHLGRCLGVTADSHSHLYSKHRITYQGFDIQFDIPGCFFSGIGLMLLGSGTGSGLPKTFCLKIAKLARQIKDPWDCKEASGICCLSKQPEVFVSLPNSIGSRDWVSKFLILSWSP